MITKNELDKLFTYEPETGNLIRKVRTTNSTQIGDIVGTNHNGYVQVNINHKMYKSHRLIWIMLHGSVDSTLTIDHENGIRSDNRISNLRLVTQAINNKNLSIRSDNTSGVTGVVWVKDRSKWRAQINIDGKTKYLGNFTNKEDAIKIREAASIEHNYHPNHGAR